VNTLPVTVIGGWLGAGKTTLVNHLLRHAGGRRLAVLVNDFGDVNIDADLIVAREGDLVRLQGGCACCRIGQDLGSALVGMATGGAGYDHVLVEASGVAQPGRMGDALSLLAGVRLAATLVVVDADTVRTRAGDRYVGDLVRDQLAAADLLVVNRTDLASREQLADLGSWLPHASPYATIHLTRHGALPPDWVLSAPPAPARPRGPAPVTADANELFVAHSIDPPHGMDPAALATALAAVPGLIRAKGFAADARGRLHVVQVAGGRPDTGPAPAKAAAGPIVCIGRRGQLDRAELERRTACAANPNPEQRRP
jgi:G3E family GTPase